MGTIIKITDNKDEMYIIIIYGMQSFGSVLRTTGGSTRIHFGSEFSKVEKITIVINAHCHGNKQEKKEGKSNQKWI